MSQRFGPAASPARKVLVIELAGLGDNMRRLPALGLVRNCWPRAELQVMLDGIAELLS